MINYSLTTFNELVSAYCALQKTPDFRLIYGENGVSPEEFARQMIRDNVAVAVRDDKRLLGIVYFYEFGKDFAALGYFPVVKCRKFLAGALAVIGDVFTSSNLRDLYGEIPVGNTKSERIARHFGWHELFRNNTTSYWVTTRKEIHHG